MKTSKQVPDAVFCQSYRNACLDCREPWLDQPSSFSVCKNGRSNWGPCHVAFLTWTCSHPSSKKSLFLSCSGFSKQQDSVNFIQAIAAHCCSKYATTNSARELGIDAAASAQQGRADERRRFGSVISPKDLGHAPNTTKHHQGLILTAMEYRMIAYLGPAS